MANGVLKSQAEYYDDSDKYTGSAGSKTNKYVIEDVFDFCCTINSVCYFEMVNDIDFNDHPDYRYGVNKTIFGGSNLNMYYYLDGNNHKIRNLVIKNSTAEIFHIAEICNVSFENLIFMGTTSGLLFTQNYGNSGIASTCTAANVQIGCYMFDSASSVLFNSTIKKVVWKNCSFNIRGKTTDGCNVSGYNNSTIYSNCHIHVDIETNNIGCINAKSIIFDSSYITGKIKTSYGSGALVLGGSGFTLKNSYFAVEMSNADDLPLGISTSFTVASTSFIDKDLIQNFSISDINNFYYLTTDQAKDRDYLLSINFPVIPLE